MAHTTYMNLRCPVCPWTAMIGPGQMAHWLERVGKIRPGRRPELEILAELFRASLSLFVCPECGQIGLIATPAEDDETDWPGPHPCSACGKPIAAERLQAIPGTTLCAACQQKEESGAATGEVEYCPKCGAPMALRLSRTPGVSRYVMACTGNPPCRT